MSLTDVIWTVIIVGVVAVVVWDHRRLTRVDRKDSGRARAAPTSTNAKGSDYWHRADAHLTAQRAATNPPTRASRLRTWISGKAVLLDRHRDGVAVVLLMLGVGLVADSYTPQSEGIYSASRTAFFEPLELAIGVGAIALAWIVYRGPRGL